MNYQLYPSNLADEQSNLINQYIPKPKKVERLPTTDMRTICDAIYYHLKTGCQWHYLPHHFPPHQTVYYYRRWQFLNKLLREQCRQKLGTEK